MQLIPAFLHIPKCGADYFLSKSWSVFIDFLIKSLSGEGAGVLNKVHRLIINKNKVPILTALVYDPFSACKSMKPCYKKHESPNNKFVSYIDYDSFLQEMKISKLKIFAVIVEPEGIPLIDGNFFENLQTNNEIRFEYITTLQDPLKMTEAFFVSILERSKKTKERACKTFSAFVRSKFAPYGWLIKKINGDNLKRINKKAYLKAIHALDKVKIFNLSDIDTLISNIYLQCHNINADQLNIKYNEEKINRKKFKLNFNNDIKDIFEKKARLDMEIYKRYCKSRAPGGI